MTNGRAQDRDASVALSPAFDLISAIRPSKITNESRKDLSRPRSIASTVQRSITVAEVVERARRNRVAQALRAKR
jgi:hypothetical protein